LSPYCPSEGVLFHGQGVGGLFGTAEVLGRRAYGGVLGFQRQVQFRHGRFSRVLDTLGYATWRRWRVYGEEGLAGREAALWLRERSLTLEYAGEPLSRYDVEYLPGTEKPRAFAGPVLFETSIPLPQLRLFGLDTLGEAGWLVTLRLADYAPRRPRSQALQQALFPYHVGWR
jgi:hypothetical protein